MVGREPEIQTSDLPLTLQSSAGPPPGSSLDEVERAHILKTLEACDWNQTKAAKVLEIDRVTLYNKIKKYGFKKATGPS